MASHSPGDLLASLSGGQAASALAPFGFRDLRRAEQGLRAMAEDPAARSALAGIASGLLHAVSLSGDPDQSLGLFERFAAATGHPQELFEDLAVRPRVLDLLARTFGASSFLGEVLVREPQLLRWVTGPAALDGPRPPSLLTGDLEELLGPHSGDHERTLDALRAFKRRELLRIGVRDVLRLATVEDTLVSLSELAGVLIEATVKVAEDAPLDAQRPGVPRGAGFAVVALGKLGGGDLNFSSDVDLLFVHASDRGRGAGTRGRPDHYDRLARRITDTLEKSTSEGQVYRVDLRLRPEGRMGSLVHSLAGFRDYYATRGRAWERLMLLKARPVAGDARVGARFLETVRPFIYGSPFGPDDVGSVCRLHAQVAARTRHRGEERTNVKLGVGGIREVELIVQALQVRFGRRDRTLRLRGTLETAAALREAGHLPPDEADALRDAYLFLRDVENKLQMSSDAQVHTLPGEPYAVRALARTLGYAEREGGAAGAFLADHARHTAVVHRIFTGLFQDGAAAQRAWPPLARVRPNRRS